MGKLAVVFFAALAFQAVFGGVTKGFGYDREELGHLVREVVTVSDEIYQTFHTTPLRRGFSWENREFGQEIEEIINYLEELTTKHDERTTGIIYNILREFREIRTYFKELYTCTEETTMRKLEIALATTIKKTCKYFETFDEIFSEEQYNHIFFNDFTTVLRKYDFVLRKLYENVNTHWVREDVYPIKRNFYADETTLEHYGDVKNVHEIVKRLEIILERVHFEDVMMKRAFMHLVRRYFENIREFITPEFHQYYQMFYYTKDSMYSTQDVKTHLFSFINKFVTKIEQMPKTAYFGFVKATRHFERHLEAMIEVNTPVRRMSLRIQTFSDLLVNWYATLPYQSQEFRGILHKHAERMVEILRSFITKIEHTETHPEFIANLKKIVFRMEKEIDQHTFVVFLQEATTEVRKFLLSRPHNTELVMHVATEYLNVLEWFAKTYKQTGVTEDIDVWAAYLMAFTNRMSLYVHNDFHSEDMHILMRQFHKMFEILEKHPHPECMKFVHTLKEIIREFETERFLFNSFLQKVALEFNQFITNVYYENNYLPREIFHVMRFYEEALEEIFINHRVIKGILTVESPMEIVLQTQTVADRVNKLLHVIVPGFKTVKVENRVHYFHQILEVVMFRLRKITLGYEKSSDVVVRRVYENLREIQNHLERVLEQTNMNTKVNFGVYIQNAFMELRKLAFEKHLVENTEFIKMYCDFLFGLEYLLNQLQFDMQVMIQDYGTKTMHLQLDSVARRITVLLHRIQAKPELKRVVLLQVEALAQELEYFPFIFKKLEVNNPIFTEMYVKYTKMYNVLRQITKMGWDKSYEQLCSFLDMHIYTIVQDLARLTPYALECAELNDVYKYTLIYFTNIMARLQNVHYYEYYHIIVKTEDFGRFVHRLTEKVSNKLQTVAVDTKEIKYDLALQTLKFAHRLENIALRFQFEGKIMPKGLFNIIAELQRVAGTQTVSVNELKVVLNRCVMAVYTEIEKIVDHESRVVVHEPLIEYIVAVEQLYFDIYSMVIRSHNQGTFKTMFTRIDLQLHYLIEAIEHIDYENKVAVNVLRTEYRRLINFVNIFATKLHEFGARSDKFQHIFEKLAEIRAFETENWTNVNEFEVKFIETLKRVLIVLKETRWNLYEIPEYRVNTEVYTIFKMCFDEFLTVVQRIHLEIATNVLHREKMYFYNKWGLFTGIWGKTFYGDNKFTGKYDEKYYGKFAKYFNKYGKQYNNFYDNEYTNQEFEPEFRGLVNHKYTGKWNLENTWEHFPKTYNYENTWEHLPKTYNWENTWEHFPKTYKYANKYDSEWKFGQKWHDIPEEFNFGTKHYNTELKYGRNWESTPEMYNTKYTHNWELPEFYKYEGPEWFNHYEGKYTTVEHPEWFKHYEHEFPTTYNYEKYMNKYQSPKYFSKYESPKHFGKYETTKYFGKYESPKYFGKYEREFPTEFNYKWNSPKYTYGNEYATYDLKTLYNKIQNIVREVTEELKEVPLTQQWVKQYYTVYVRELVEIVDLLINRFEEETTKDYKFGTMIEVFRHIKVELKQLLTTTYFHQPSQVKYQLFNTIEQILSQFEKLAYVEQHNEVPFFKEIFVRFFNVIRNVKYQIKNNVYERDYTGFNTEFNYKHETPFFYKYGVKDFPRVNYELNEVY